MADATLPRPVRLANPGDIEHGDPWNGLSPDQPDDRFCKFTSPAWGFRAIARTLVVYQDRYKVANIGQAITRWAPPADNNDTGAYIAAVCKATKRTPDEAINFHDYNDSYGVIRAIAEQECGAPFAKYWKKSDLDLGCVKAGLENAPRGGIGAVGRIVGTAVTAGATAAANNPDVLQSAYNTVRPIADTGPHIIQAAFWCVVAIVGGTLVLGEIRKYLAKKG